MKSLYNDLKITVEVFVLRWFMPQQYHDFIVCFCWLVKIGGVIVLERYSYMSIC